MRQLLRFMVISALIATRLHGQQADASHVREHVRVYTAESGLKRPQLIPRDFLLSSIDKCEHKTDGQVELSILVDKAGNARNMWFIRPLGTDADVLALQIARSDRFEPGTLDGSPVVVAVSLKIKIQACLYEQDDNEGRRTYTFQFLSIPHQELGAPVYTRTEATLAPSYLKNGAAPKEGNPASSAFKEYIVRSPTGLSAPVVLYRPEAEYTEAAQKAVITGICNDSLVVDSQGMPQRPKVVKSLDPGLDASALVAASRFRFKPAMKDGKPVAVVAIVEINFQLRH